MATSTVAPTTEPSIARTYLLEPPAEQQGERWYVLQTRSNHEKNVSDQLQVRDVTHFLPTYSSVRRWKDRRVTLLLPLFPGYVFVWLTLRDRMRVLQIPGAARLVGFSGLPCALPNCEMDALRQALSGSLDAEPHPYLKIGRRLVVKNGPLKGLQGTLVRKKNEDRFVISVDLIMRSVAVEIDEADVGTV
jgi:transcription termination/antitermination protein NusG